MAIPMEILGWVEESKWILNGKEYSIGRDQEIPEELEDVLRKLHEETQKVLQIAIDT